MTTAIRNGQVTDNSAAAIPVPGASIYVYNLDGTAAALTSDGVTPITQPLTTDQFGNYSYQALVGYYREDTWFAGKLRFREDNIALGNPGADLALRSDLAAPNGGGLVEYGIGSTYSTGTVGKKLQEVPAITDYATQAALAASSGASFFMPQGKSLSVSGSLIKDYWGPGAIALVSGDKPGSQGGARHGFAFIAPVTPGTGQNFGLVSKLFTGTRTDTASAPGQNHGAALYGEAQRGAGSSDGVWGLNTITEVYNLDGATIGYEIDVNNVSGVDPGLSPAQAFLGLSVVSGNAGRGGTAITVLRNGSFGSNHWNRGIHVKDVLQRGIEFASCGVATGIWSDRTINLVQTANTDIPIVKITPFDDLNPTGSIMFLTDAAGTTTRVAWLKRGEVAINTPSVIGTNGIGIRGIANGDNILYVQRNTDTSPNGTFLRAVNAAGTTVLFDLDYNITANETNLKLSMAGAAATRVSVGAADSGGTGFRLLRLPN